MFQVSQQSVQLRSRDDLKTMQDGDEPNPPVTITFQTFDADASKCILKVDTPDGETHRLMFNKGGLLIDQRVEETNPEQNEEPVELDADGNPIGRDGLPHMRGMRDTRADDPYTYQPPIPGEVVARGDVAAGPAPARNSDNPAAGPNPTPAGVVQPVANRADPAQPVAVTDRTRPRPNEGQPEDNPNSTAAQGLTEENQNRGPSVQEVEEKAAEERRQQEEQARAESGKKRK